MPTAGRLLYGNAKPCGFSMDEGHLSLPGMTASLGSVTRPLRLPEGICACATRTDVANRKIRAAPRFAIKGTPFFLLRCGANLNKASDAVISLPVGCKAILRVEAQMGNGNVRWSP